MKLFLIIFIFLPKTLSSDNSVRVNEENPNLVPENVIVTLTTYVPNQKETD